MHMIRTPKIPFLQSWVATLRLVMTGLIIAIGIFLPMGSLAHSFKQQALPPQYFLFMSAILLTYVELTQAMKNLYAHRSAGSKVLAWKRDRRDPAMAN